MNKRGQVYLLAAILLALIIFVLLNRSNLVGNRFFDDGFEDLSENYDRESSIFINILVEEKLRHGDLDLFLNNFSEFTVDFSVYSKTENPEFGMIYLFDVVNTNNNLFTGNYLDQDVIMMVNGNITNASALEGCRSGIVAGSVFDGFGIDNGIDVEIISNCTVSKDTLDLADYNVTFIIGDVQYDADVTSNVPEIMIVSQEFKNDQRRVFLNEEFISGDKIDISAFCGVAELSLEAKDSEICSCDRRNSERKCEKLNSLDCSWVNGVCQDG